METAKEINDDIDYLFHRINWKVSAMDSKATRVMNSLRKRITLLESQKSPEDIGLTDDYFKFSKIREEELKAKMSEEDLKKIFADEMEFNNEVQLCVINLIHKRNLTTNFIVGTLYKLAWQIMNRDFIEQMEAMEKYEQGGR